MLVLCAFADKLLHIDPLSPLLEQAMIQYDVPAAEISPAADFIRGCLHPNPQSHSPAAELRTHPWVKKAFMCC